MERLIHGQNLVSGSAQGKTLISLEPLSFWGGYSQSTGEIIDRRHPLSGQIGAGRIIGIPFTRGSSTSTAILLESARVGVAPAAVVLASTDPFVALASVVADELYGKGFPVVSVSDSALKTLTSDTFVRIDTLGNIYVE